MSMRTLEECDELLRAAVQAQDFERTQAAAAEYRRAFDAEWNALSEAERRRSELAQRASVLMSWALCIMTLYRTGLFARRRSAKAAGSYVQNRRAASSHTWGVAG